MAGTTFVEPRSLHFGQRSGSFAVARILYRFSHEGHCHTRRLVRWFAMICPETWRCQPVSTDSHSATCEPKPVHSEMQSSSRRFQESPQPQPKRTGHETGGSLFPPPTKNLANPLPIVQLLVEWSVRIEDSCATMVRSEKTRIIK